ncbi:CidA/LrgA family protein [Clostridium cochlearium]|uniref:CidA/LrgA family protein n=1 Tax=Clostridium cochlearium TaxID=1494 RepID=A0A7Y3V7K4_CLOCO|nr:CidA/LrgA family protein [Clostridium cochlearium]MCG4580534.1 CidA/LrgA family protein [Clostridium cochlearium]MCR1971790.1 CidA/LrgA family protein [Clostridium cochlearium]NOH16143.1 CidA/LrgA family protein [Clostridium cochlearium]NSJ92282.1 CidA/LrgA family protein [Coprococcus sp. MSK.21.13]
MKILRELGIILSICVLGEIIHSIFKLSIPGNVIGMIILFILLYLGVIKVNMISQISKFLLDHLAFFFVPAGVGILSCMPFLKGKWIVFLLICIISTIIVIWVTGWTIQTYIRKVDGK